MNKVFLIGNLTRDPELSTTPGGVSVCRFSIAVNRSFASQDGTRETDFFNITVWRSQAENCSRFLKKGNKVAVIGSLQNRSYEVDGQKRFATDIIANEVEFLTPKGEPSSDDEVVTTRKPRPQLEPMDDDGLPF